MKKTAYTSVGAEKNQVLEQKYVKTCKGSGSKRLSTTVHASMSVQVKTDMEGKEEIEKKKEMK